MNATFVEFSIAFIRETYIYLHHNYAVALLLLLVVVVLFCCLYIYIYGQLSYIYILPLNLVGYIRAVNEIRLQWNSVSFHHDFVHFNVIFFL